MIKTRMAPSPTGEFHIGSMRTLLYNYAFAKSKEGKFVLRIEDTDRARYVEGATERLMAVVKSYGLGWDEGPYIQSERLDIYKKHSLILVEKDVAYYCFCTPERLKDLRKEQQKNKMPSTKYDRHCLKLSKEEITEKVASGEKYVIRLKIPTSENIEFEDLILGKISFPSKDIDDQILLKSDGYPTYHLAVVVDDHLMKISHVIRGVEWLASTPKHILLYKYLGWNLPLYAHIPLLKESNSTKKLSKREGSVASKGFLEKGYLAEALLNFLMFLGWNPGTDKEIYTLEEFIKDFSLGGIQKTDLVSFDRDKLLWTNGTYIRNMSVAELWKRLNLWATEYNIELNKKSKDKEFNVKVLGLVQERLKIFSEYNGLTHYFYKTPSVDRKLLFKYTKENESRTKRIISKFIEILSSSNWSRSELEEKCKGMIKKEGYSPKEAFMTLRVVLTNEKATPQIFDILEVLGKKTVLSRLKSLVI